MQREFYSDVLHFVDDPSFREWVLREVEDDKWESWLDANPDKAVLAREARNILLAMGSDQTAPGSVETERALEYSWQRIRQLEDNGRSTGLRLFWKLSAAMLVLALGLTWYFFVFDNPHSFEGINPIAESLKAGQRKEVHNDTGIAMLINLLDGSSVLLQPDSKLSYFPAFDTKNREVHLSGEAFFEISKDPERPFLVFTRDIVTKVTGTSFGVKAIEGQPNVEVFVKTGEVNVRQIDPDKNSTVPGIDVLPNEFVSFRREQKTFAKSTMKAMPKRAIEYLSFEFVDTPVAEIFKTIETAYGVSVEYPELLKDCHLSTFLNDEPLLEKFKIICEILGGNSTFEMKNNVVTIHSNGCN